MAKQFRVNELILSGFSIAFNPSNTTGFLRKDGYFAIPPSGMSRAEADGTYYPSFNPSGFVTGVRHISETGTMCLTSGVSGNAIRVRGLTGAGNVSIYLSGQSIVVSGSAAEGAGEINTASNIGTGIGLVSGKVGVDIKVKTLVSASPALEIVNSGNNSVAINYNLGDISSGAFLVPTGLSSSATIWKPIANTPALEEGTWLVIGQVLLYTATTNLARPSIRLTDGSNTVYSYAEATPLNVATTGELTLNTICFVKITGSNSGVYLGAYSTRPDTIFRSTPFNNLTDSGKCSYVQAVRVI
jgi:hypothetical protein